MSKKNNVNEFRIREDAKIEIERDVLRAQNEELKKIIAESRAKPVEPAPAAAPVASTPVVSVLSEYRRLKEISPYEAAAFLLQNQHEAIAEADAARRGGK